MSTTQYFGLIGLIGLGAAGICTALIAQEPAPPAQPPLQSPQGNPFGADPQSIPARPQEPFAGQAVPGFGPQPQGGPVGPPFGMNPFPELAKKTNAIMALRVIVESGLTAKEIQAILPALRDLRDAEKNFKSRSEQMLDEEKKALLAAPPGGPLPPNSGPRMQESVQSFHEKTQQAWATIDRELGAGIRQDGLNKAQMLRQLVMGGPGPGVPWGLNGNFNGQGFGNPNAFPPGQPGQGFFTPQPGGQNFYAPQPGQSPPPSGQGGKGRGGRGGGQEASPRAELPAGSGSNDLFIEQVPAPGAPPAELPGIGEPVAPPAEEGVFQVPPANQQPGFQGQPVPGRNVPKGRGGQLGGAGYNWAPDAARNWAGTPQPFWGGGPRISLAELVELLEQRLAAMPK